MILQKQFKALLLPILILILSVLSFSGYIRSSNYFGILITIVGIIGVVMFFLKKGNPNLLFKIWVLSQLPAIYSQNRFVAENGMQFFKESPIFMTNQIIDFSLGINLGLHNGTNLYIGIYLISLLYLGLYKLTSMNYFVNREVIFSPLKSDSQFTNTFPVKGTILRRITLEKEIGWFLVACDEKIIIDGIETQEVLIKSKEDKLLSKKEAVFYLRVSKMNNEVPDIINNKNDYPFYEWMYVRLI